MFDLSQPSRTVSLMDPLTDTERTLLRLASAWWSSRGALEEVVRRELDLSVTHFWQAVNVLIDDPRALAAEPVLVRRLQHIRETRQRSRSTRRLSA